jgi:outer membrane protein OmpA-like peptidoglycan-associated protein
MAEVSRPLDYRRTVLLVSGCLLAIALAGCTPAKAPPPAPPPKKYEAPDERFVFFAIGKAEVMPEGFFNIGYVVAMLDTNPAFHVLVVGHADQNGKSDRELSLKRARAVRKLLVERGVKDNRILIAAPLAASEASVAQLNRRADLFVYDPLQDEASTRLGYKVEVKQE